MAVEGVAAQTVVRRPRGSGVFTQGSGVVDLRVCDLG
jgi:hypothetical protein